MKLIYFLGCLGVWLIALKETKPFFSLLPSLCLFVKNISVAIQPNLVFLIPQTEYNHGLWQSTGDACWEGGGVWQPCCFVPKRGLCFSETLTWRGRASLKNCIFRKECCWSLMNGYCICANTCSLYHVLPCRTM